MHVSVARLPMGLEFPVSIEIRKHGRQLKQKRISTRKKGCCLAILLDKKKRFKGKKRTCRAVKDPL